MMLSTARTGCLQQPPAGCADEEATVKRIGLLTSGGDCQGLNTAMRGVAKALYEALPDVEVIGFLDGYKGLIEDQFRIMSPSDFSGILTLGGTILGTSRQPFKTMRLPLDPSQPDGQTRLDRMVENSRRHELDGLVILGGNGTHKTANLLCERGVPVITLPKTIDNDLWGTDVTFGFHSAVDVATDVIDSIHTTATSHGRVFIIELMGHSAGWLTLYAGIAGGADIILIPEIPYDIGAISAALRRRAQQSKRFSIIALAEGAISTTQAGLSKKARTQQRQSSTYPSVAYEVAASLAAAIGQEIRVTIPGHYQRGGHPSAFDRVLATRFGTAAARLVLENRYGYMVGMRGHEVIPVPLADVAGKLKLVPADSSIVASARALGTSFGDLPR